MTLKRERTPKAVLVTGAARRLGAVVVRRFAEQGWAVAIHYAGSRLAARRLADGVIRRGGRAELFPMDFLQAEPGVLIDEVRRVFPGLQALINNASLFERTPLDELDGAILEKHWRINFLAPVLLSQAFRRRIKRGAVVNILDTAVSGTRGSHAAYLLAKKNLMEYTRMAALAWAPRIRVNAVCPGFVLPPADDPAFRETARLKHIPMGRRIRPDDVAEAVLFLINNPSVTGELLFVDGGEHLRAQTGI